MDIWLHEGFVLVVVREFIIIPTKIKLSSVIVTKFKRFIRPKTLGRRRQQRARKRERERKKEQENREQNSGKKRRERETSDFSYGAVAQ
jgi:hypothetical protein